MKKLKLDPMADVLLCTVAEVTAPLQNKISHLEAHAAGDARKIKRLCELLIRADTALANLGIGRKAPVRVNIHDALRTS